MKIPPSPLRAQRGSLLIVAMLLSAVIAIAITSYVQLGRTAGTISNRAFYNNAAMNIAEAGIEQAMWSINRMIADDGAMSPAWDDWKTDDNINYIRAFKNFSLGQNVSSYVNVHVELLNFKGQVEPKVTTRSVLTPVRGAAIEKWVRVELQRASVFANGLVAKKEVLFRGNNPTVDSWNSGWHPDPSESKNIPYDSTSKNDAGSVGSISVTVDNVSVKNADIYGYVSTGKFEPAIGPQGLIGPFGTPKNTIVEGHTSTDFTANFDPVTQPTGGTALGVINGPGTITAGTYSVTSISVAGAPGSNLVIEGDVVLHVSGDIKFTGNGGIVIKTGASLTIYCPGTIDIAGNGVLNGGSTAATAQQPAKFQIWGTDNDASLQSISIAGNGVLSGVVYAPNASVKINGNGDVFGSVIANNIDVTGEALFHYDEALSNFGGDNPFRLKGWNELTSSTERGTYKSKVDF